jgi:hypothetical protein
MRFSQVVEPLDDVVLLFFRRGFAGFRVAAHALVEGFDFSLNRSPLRVDLAHNAMARDMAGELFLAHTVERKPQQTKAPSFSPRFETVYSILALLTDMTALSAVSSVAGYSVVRW